MQISIYPGTNIWIKRLKYSIYLSSIGFSLFISQLQTCLWRQTQEIVTTVEPLMKSASSVAEIIEGSLLPLMERLEQSKFGATVAQFDVPQSADLHDQVDNIKTLESTIRKLSPVLPILSLIMRWTSILMCLPILISILWLAKDLEKGRHKLVTMILILIAIAVNFWSYDLLHSMFQIT